MLDTPYVPVDSIAEFPLQMQHPMKPHRVRMTNTLVTGYGMHKLIDHLYDVRSATQAELEMYHDHDYIEFLSRCVVEW